MISINFQRLFTVQILNKYYTNGLCNDFTIIPSARTASVMGGYKLVQRQYGNRLYVGIPADNTGVPALAPEEGTQLIFFLKCDNPLFFNFTNSPVGGIAGNMLYFTNKNNNPGAGALRLLSAPIPGYNSATAYDTGDLALSAGTVYEAVLPNTNKPVTDTTNWLQVDNGSYVSGADVKHIHKDPALQASDTNDLSHFIPAADYAELLSATGVCAVLNIVNDSTLTNGYSLLAGGKVTVPPAAPKLFTIWFLNRAVKWTYVLLPASTGTIAQTAPGTGTPAFPGTTVPPNRFTSAYPLRFNDVQQTFAFQLTTSDGQVVKPLPLASPEIIRLDTTSKGLYSEIYLNY